MKFLILSYDYSDFLNWLYSQNPGLENRSYDEQMQARNKSLFGMADFYSSNLRKLGHEAYDIRVNNEFMQRQWAQEQGVTLGEMNPLTRGFREGLRQTRRIVGKTPLKRFRPLFSPVHHYLDRTPARFFEIITAQIKYYKPDVIFNQATDSLNSRFLGEIKQYAKLLMGQIASPLPPGENWSVYDLMISSLPNFVDYFRKLGVPSELNRLAFESTILNRFGTEERRKDIPISFIGSFFPIHQERIRLLEYLCAEFDIKIFGTWVDKLSENSAIRRRYAGNAWGIEMYQILRNSKITLNKHISSVAASFANNMRLFEATGVGTFLITDWKQNLSELFEPGKEIVAYHSPEECAELIRYYLKHDEEREAIAKAGQKRTLKDHTYYQRMQELAGIVSKYL